jgi:hypothetical protein
VPRGAASCRAGRVPGRGVRAPRPRVRPQTCRAAVPQSAARFPRKGAARSACRRCPAPRVHAVGRAAT